MRIAGTYRFSGFREPYTSLYLAAVSFLTYAFMYAYRKPYTAATFSDVKPLFGLPYKDMLVILQLLGYSTSKLFGIRLIAELSPVSRGRLLLLFVFISWMALFCFAIIHPPWNAFFLLLNGLPLGWIWGIVFSFVEGRITSDFIGSSLAVSFIFSSGAAKSLGKYVMQSWHVPENWMPFVVGAIILLPMCMMTFLLTLSPAPTVQDQLLRVKREKMYRMDRKRFIQEFLLGMIFLIIIYTFLTLFRDIRDNFMADMWSEIYHNRYFNPDIFAVTETPIALILLVMMSMLVWIKKNRIALQLTWLFIILGFLLTGFSCWLYMRHLISGFYWILLTGVGLYMGYIPFNCVLYDRLIAYLKTPANVGFLMYVSDAFGYFASLGVIFGKSLLASRIPWTYMYSRGVWWFSWLGIALTVAAWYYFLRRTKPVAHIYA